MTPCLSVALRPHFDNKVMINIDITDLVYTKSTHEECSNSGALDEGPPMSHVDFKKRQYHMSLCLISPMSYVEFKKRRCPMSL